MKQLLLLALPLVLAGCPSPQHDASATSAASNTSAASSAPANPAAQPALKPMDPNAQIPFSAVGPIQATNLLPRQHWALKTAVDAKGQPISALLVRADKPITLDFAGGRLSIDNACNKLSTAYKLSASNVVTEPFASTMMACADAKLAALDQAASQRLTGTLGMRMTSGGTALLELTNKAGDVLVFEGTQTAEAKYGGPGERVFLEISADAKPCADDKTVLCVPMREIKYDDKGLKMGTPGPFTESRTLIEGFAVRPGVHSVVRVNRFPLKTPAKDGSKFAYVLDMVVEVDVVKPTGAAVDGKPEAGKPGP
ncbi:MAG: META domain-containing protein [Xanthomonadaceae bacterium]|nr:META domain-containing protein [Xanthomonadaceae bacterium]